MNAPRVGTVDLVACIRAGMHLVYVTDGCTVGMVQEEDLDEDERTRMMVSCTAGCNMSVLFMDSPGHTPSLIWDQ